MKKTFGHQVDKQKWKIWSETTVYFTIQKSINWVIEKNPVFILFFIFYISIHFFKIIIKNYNLKYEFSFFGQ